MIGIQSNTVVNLDDGKVTGAVLSKYWFGGVKVRENAVTTRSLKRKMVIKDVEVLDPTTSVPKAMVNMIFITDNAGNLVIPKKRPSVLGFLNMSYWYYMVFGLSHEINSSEINLYVEFRKHDDGVKTRFNLMYWESADFRDSKDWNIEYHAISIRQNGSEERILQACAIADGTDVYDIHIQIAADSSMTKSLTLFKSKIMEVPETKEALGSFYDTVSQLYKIEEGKLFDDWNSPIYVDGVPNTSDSVSAMELQVDEQNSEISRMNEKLDAVAVSTTSRFVSR